MRLKIFFLGLVTLLLVTQVSAKEMDLYKNYDGDEEFSTLTLKEQYTSYINSFINKGLILEQPMSWAYMMVDQHGRDILPYLNNSITDYCSRPQKIMFILQKADGESTYNKLFYEIKKDLFQTEKEFFADRLKALITI